MKDKTHQQLGTKAIHAGEPDPKIHHAVTLPIFQSSASTYTSGTPYNDLQYIRLNNTPNHKALHAKIAALEGTEAALVTSSGMAALTTTCLAFLTHGDGMMAQTGLYGGTVGFFRQDCPAFGIDVAWFDGQDPSSWEAALTPQTKVLFLEGLTNPLLELADIEGLVAFAKQHNLLTMIDNTFASPINFRPHEWGIDIVIHSASKYLNGHSDLVAGCVAGSNTHMQTILHKLNHLGGSLDPHACFLLHRGLKTLALRVERQNQNAMALASMLHAHPKVERVHYPGLTCHPQHERAKRLLDGCGGMISFALQGGEQAARAFIERATIPIQAVSLGGVESLVSLPQEASHAGLSQTERHNLGIVDGLIRMSVGIEDQSDLLADCQQALRDHS